MSNFSFERNLPHSSEPKNELLPYIENNFNPQNSAESE